MSFSRKFIRRIQKVLIAFVCAVITVVVGSVLVLCGLTANGMIFGKNRGVLAFVIELFIVLVYLLIPEDSNE